MILYSLTMNIRPNDPFDFVLRAAGKPVAVFTDREHAARVLMFMHEIEQTHRKDMNLEQVIANERQWGFQKYELIPA